MHRQPRATSPPHLPHRMPVARTECRRAQGVLQRLRRRLEQGRVSGKDVDEMLAEINSVLD